MAYKEDLQDFFIAKNYMVKLYREHISECNFPDEVEKLLDRYVKSDFLDNEALELIEADYPVATIKEVTAKVAILENQMLSPKIKTKFKINYNLIAVIVVILVGLILYNTLFRYKYRTYKDGYNRVQVIKIDTLTGKSTVSFPEYAN